MFDSFFSRDCGGTVVCLPTGLNPMSTGFFSPCRGLFGSKQSLGISDLSKYSSSGSSKGGGSIGLKFGSTNGLIPLALHEKATQFLLEIVRNVKCTSDNFLMTLFGPNQLCINFLDNPFLVLGV